MFTYSWRLWVWAPMSKKARVSLGTIRTANTAARRSIGIESDYGVSALIPYEDESRQEHPRASRVRRHWQ